VHEEEEEDGKDGKEEEEGPRWRCRSCAPTRAGSYVSYTHDCCASEDEGVGLVLERWLGDDLKEFEFEEETAGRGGPPANDAQLPSIFVSGIRPLIENTVSSRLRNG
jgi:hypothetical protein